MIGPVRLVALDPSSLSMTRPTDLAERIARLERLLDRLEQSRPGEPVPARGDVLTADERLRGITALLDERAGEGTLDGSDAIAMRALLDQIRSMTAELRARASEVSSRLEAAAASVEGGRESLEALEDVP